jgi:hypothetical protein
LKVEGTLVHCDTLSTPVVQQSALVDWRRAMITTPGSGGRTWAYKVGVARGASIIALLLATVAAVSILPIRGASQAPQPQSQDGVAAFERIATVLQSPRCLNCHPRGDRPAQGDDRHTRAWPATDVAASIP